MICSVLSAHINMLEYMKIPYLQDALCTAGSLLYLCVFVCKSDPNMGEGLRTGEHLVLLGLSSAARSGSPTRLLSAAGRQQTPGILR